MASSSSIDDECALVREWLTLAGLEKAHVREAVAQHLKDQIMHHFDATKLDETVAAAGGLPAWVDLMIADARWRPLLLELCAAHPQSQLLTGIVRTLSQSEHAAEVQANTALGAVLGGASSMQTFLSSFAAQLNGLRQGQSGAQVRLEGIACAGEPEFLVGQMLLRSPALRDHPEYGAHAEQAAAAMAKSAGRNGQAYRRLHLLSLGVPRVSPLMSALISLLRSAGDDFAKGNSYWIDQTISAADAVTLDEQCAANGSSTIALRDPTILKILLQALFDPAKPPKPGPREQLLRVIARVAADAAEECEDTSAVLEEASVSESKAHARRAKVHAVLTEAQKICETNEVSEVDAQVAILRRCSSSEPACACGLLVWTRRNLTTPQFSGARFNGTFLPAMLQLVGSIAEAHPGLQGEVCDLVHAILIHEPGKEAEDVSAETAVTLRRRLLECLLWLLTRGCVFPVLAKLHEWLKTADYSLVRHLFTQLLTLCSPPYSEAFGRKLLAMVKEARTLEAHRGDEQRRGLKAFVQAAARTEALEEEAGDVLDLL